MTSTTEPLLIGQLNMNNCLVSLEQLDRTFSNPGHFIEMQLNVCYLISFCSFHPFRDPCTNYRNKKTCCCQEKRSKFMGYSLGIRDRRILRLLCLILWLTFSSLWLCLLRCGPLLKYSPVMLHLSPATKKKPWVQLDKYSEEVFRAVTKEQRPGNSPWLLWAWPPASS